MCWYCTFGTYRISWQKLNDVDYIGVAEHSEKQETASQKAIERDDWPGPPEPAVAYPELCTCSWTTC